MLRQKFQVETKKTHLGKCSALLLPEKCSVRYTFCQDLSRKTQTLFPCMRYYSWLIQIQNTWSYSHTHKFWCLCLWTLILLRWLNSLVWYLIQNNPEVSHVNLIHVTQNKNQNNQINRVFATYAWKMWRLNGFPSLKWISVFRRYKKT